MKSTQSKHTISLDLKALQVCIKHMYAIINCLCLCETIFRCAYWTFPRSTDFKICSFADEPFQRFVF